MSSPFRCAGDTIARPIAGVDPTITARALWLETHPLPTIPGTGDIARPSFQASVGTDQRNSKGDRPVNNGGPNRETNPIISVDPQ
jgi:hypothetical protein